MHRLKVTLFLAAAALLVMSACPPLQSAEPPATKQKSAAQPQPAVKGPSSRKPKAPPQATAPAKKDRAQEKAIADAAVSDDTNADAEPGEETNEDRPRAIRDLPGMQRSGSILLPNGWSLRPAGKQIKLGDFPINIALHPSQPWAAILHTGYGEHEIAVVDLKKQAIVSRVTLDQAFYGLCFDPAGERLFASGAEFEVVHQFSFADGYLSQHKELVIGPVNEKLVPTGLICSADGKTLYVANAWGAKVAIVPLDEPANLEQVAFEEGSYPYTTLPTPDGKRLYVSLWGQAAVSVLNLETKAIEATWDTDSHPTEMVQSADGGVLYVACANSNSVTVIETATGKTLEVITSALYPKAPNGSTPNSLSLSPDGKVLLIANADNNNVALFNVTQPGKSHSMGHIPVGWYPTSVRFNPLDNRIYVANGKGLMSKANTRGPQPLQAAPETTREYIGGLFRGTLSVIEPPAPDEMARYSKNALVCSPLNSENSPTAQPRHPDNPIPAKLGDASPIKHCIYIIKENRTYDQVFGDLPQGNGDANLCIFPREVTPNHHKLAEQFVLLDNFYVESEVSADGHQWSTAAYATDFTEKTWPLVYRGKKKGKLVYPSESGLDIIKPAGGYIWERCRDAKVSYFSYGEFVHNGRTPEDPGTAAIESLEGHFDPGYRSYDLDYTDAKRADRFIEQLQGFEEQGELPQFIVLRLPNDHTYGQAAGKPTPTAMVADNDQALGRIVEAISKSKFWPETAIFVVEDDAQNGSDHVDAHRTVALVISPFCRMGSVDSNMYSTASMLRSMELILGLQPMSQFDAAARPMYDSFQAEPTLDPYEPLQVEINMAAVNAPDAWGAAASAKLDFSREDAADDLLLNDIVWRSVRGADHPMPAPVRASFVIVHGEEDEDEDD